jgi:hypothetical protein
VGISTSSVTRSSTGNVALTQLYHISFKETGGASASFTLRADASNGRVVCSRQLVSGDSDDVDYSNPEKASNDAPGQSPIFHLTVDSGAVSVTCTGSL